jgi:restriction endonuclease S subunit
MEPEYNTYNLPLRNNSQYENAYMPPNMYQNPFEFTTKFSKNDLLNCINKSIYTTTKYFEKIHHINSNTGEELYTINQFIVNILQHITPLRVHVISRGQYFYYFHFRSNFQFQCKNGRRKCLEEHDLANVKMHKRKSTLE